MRKKPPPHLCSWILRKLWQFKATSKKRYSDKWFQSTVPRPTSAPRKVIFIVVLFCKLQDLLFNCSDNLVKQQDLLFYCSDKLVKQQLVVSNCYISIAKLCTGKNVCPPKWHAFVDDVMSQSELTKRVMMSTQK